VVKNITIKQEAYDALTKRKGNKSYSDVILDLLKNRNSARHSLNDSIQNYGAKDITLSTQSRMLLDKFKFSSESYDEVINRVFSSSLGKHALIRSVYGKMSDSDWDYRAMSDFRNSFGGGKK
jgi:predicted CopG family antitoxin